ncbi:MAG: hypothetical protein AABW67_03475 [Nanoarchaeota archaeon]
MKRGLWIILGIISLIVISNVLAYQSTITVKTGLPNQDIIFRAANQVDGKTLPGGEFRAKSDSGGEVIFGYNLEPILIKMSFMAWNGNSYSTFLNGKEAIFIPNVILNEFVDVNLNQANASVNAYSNKTKEEPKAESIIENATKNNSGINVQVEVNNSAVIENETIVTSENQEKTETSKLTGFVINNGKEVLTSLVTYYILGGLLILIAGFIFIKKKMGKKKLFTVTKYSEIQKNKKESIKEDSAIANAEKKLEEAKREIDEIKNRKSRIEQAKKRLEDAKRELDELGEY